MFVDKVDVIIRAGKGGNGKLSFRHEKFVDRGGPDGGDGGDGGDVVVVASNNQNTLANFRYKKLVEAKPGGDGDRRKMHGKRGEDLVVELPVGTVISNNENKVIADLTTVGQREVIAKGGDGGFGNAHFISSTRQAPRVAELGVPGEEIEATFELKMIADIGLIGLPNAGKSTLLSKISNARPEISDYPFTTLRPNLGVVDIDKSTTVLFADIPGLIEGASQGKGLGDEFLRHVERTKLFVHLIDVYGDDIASSYKTIVNELKHYKVDLSKRPQIIAINKIDGMDQEIVDDQIKTLKSVAKRGTKILAISAHSGVGVKELLYEVKSQLQKSSTKAEKSKETSLPVIKLEKADDQWNVVKKKSRYFVTGGKIEKFAHKTDFQSPDAVARLKDIVRRMGIAHELDRKGAEADDTVVFGDPEIGRINY
ncbi:GTPase ObgE [Candidatus Saccharibacteria bacterium]|nr:GTPase ObgE [Candidatus Saccharibacteria bacterium]